jgi:hypothetical protein
MALDQLKSAALPQALSEILADVADLVQKEIRLARAEITAKLNAKLMGGVWMAAAGVLGFVAFLFLLEAIAHFIASFGLALHWSYGIVAAAVALAATLAFMKGRADVAEDMVPERAIRNLKTDISAAKEHLA